MKTKRVHFLTAAALAAATLLACDLSDSKPESVKAEWVSTFPDPVYRGSAYTVTAGLKECASSCTLRVLQGDSVIGTLEASSATSFQVTLQARASRDTLRLIASDANGQDTLLHVFQARNLGGFAPIEASATRVYREESGGSLCSGGGPLTVRQVTLQPLGLSSQGYRFKRETAGLSGADSGKVLATDTLLLRRPANVVQLWADTGWTTPGMTAFPYFAQDTITTGLEPNAKGIGISATLQIPLSGNSHLTAVYREGTGLVDYQAVYGLSVCGPSTVHRITLR